MILGNSAGSAMTGSQSPARIFLSVLVVLTLLNLCGCTIDGYKVNVDEKTKVYTYRDNGRKVTGTVIFYEIDKTTHQQYKAAMRTLKDGLRVGEGFTYFPDGQMNGRFTYKNGLLNGLSTTYWPNGNVESICEWKEEKKNGSCKVNDENGVLKSEIVYENDEPVKEYDYDSKGVRIIPAIDKLELVDVKTGFFAYSNKIYGKVLYQPMVLLKFKNIDTVPLTQKIELHAVYVSRGEELGNVMCYLNEPSGTLFKPDVTKQICLRSDSGYIDLWAIPQADVECHISADKKKYKTISISKDVLLSNTF